MHRGQVNVAGLYDWTENSVDCFSVSSLYRELVTIPRTSSMRASKLKAQLVAKGEVSCSSSCGLNTTSHGRLAFRDKKTLTRGEMDIVEGINKNRLVSSSRDSPGKPETQTKSHSDSRCSGKRPHDGQALVRIFMKGEKIDFKPFTAYFQVQSNKRCPSWLTEWAENEATSSQNPPNCAGCNHLNCQATGSDVNYSAIQVPLPVRTLWQENRRRREQTNRNGCLDEHFSTPAPSTPDSVRCRNSEHFEKNKRNYITKLPRGHILEDTSLHWNKFSSTSAERLPCLTPAHLNNTGQKTQEALSPFKTANEKTNYEAHLPAMYAKNSSQFQDNVDFDHRNRKIIKVQIYIPTAEPDHLECEASAPAETERSRLVKEKPLSQNEFRGKSQ